MFIFRYVYTGLIFLCPLSAYAAVYINEIAWMGTETSANDEWIELYNAGANAVSLDGWVLHDNASLEIPLSGSIASGDFAVLERTDDASAPGSAFLIYTGSLSNSGTTLTLVRANNAVEDQVAGGEGWANIGGNNDTKETAQYTDEGWITAQGTPGYTNASQNSEDTPDDESEEDVVVEENDDTAENDVDDDDHSGERISLVIPDNELTVTIEGPKTVFVNQPVSYTAEGRGIGKTLNNSLTYVWNFGDAHTDTGKEVTHIYTYPGEYVLVAEASHSRHRAAVRHEVTVLPQMLSMTRNASGDVQVHNDAVYEVDISGLAVVGDDRFVFPSHSIMLPRSTITIPHKRLENGVQKLIAVYDTEGVALATVLPAHFAKPVVAEIESPILAKSVSPTPKKSEGAVVQQVASSVIIPKKPSSDEPVVVPFRDVTTSEAIVAVSTTTAEFGAQQVAAVGTRAVKNERLPYLGLIGVIALGLFGLYARNPRG